MLECDDAIVREGVRALLAERYAAAKQRQRERTGWTSFQAADRLFLESMQRHEEDLQFPNDVTREAAWIEFQRYAYQWY